MQLVRSGLLTGAERAFRPASIPAAAAGGVELRRAPVRASTTAAAAPCRATNERGEVLEARFGEWLERLQLDAEDLILIRQAVADLWDDQHGGRARRRQVAGRRLTELRKRRQRLFEAFVYDQVVDPATYQEEKTRLDLALAEAERDADGAAERSAANLTEALDLAEEFAGHAAEKWWTLEPGRRREFQILLFPEGISYHPDGKFRTLTMCPLFKDLGAVSRGKAGMVRFRGLEPLTYGSGGRRSIQLS